MAAAREWVAPFDSVADRYDEVFTESRIGRAQREAVWRELSRAFRPGMRVLELGCGTGVDALRLAENGICVLGCDQSPRMIAVARRKLGMQRPAAPVEFRLITIEEIGPLAKEGTFDGVFSNFGALNCVSELPVVARALGRLLKPEAHVVLCLLGPFCVWETVWYLGQGRLAQAFRRLRAGGVTARIGTGLQVEYPSVRSVAQAFAPTFQLQSWMGIGIVVPPSYVSPWADRFPRLLEWSAHIDRRIAGWPGIRGMADHVLLHLVRGR